MCVAAFIAVLLTTRLDEIAHFISLGSEGAYILLFTLYQIPYILPIAIPLSCLISALLLMQRLSTTHELTAFRASGLSLREILTPILIAAAILSVVNFFIVSEIATHSHLQSGMLKSKLRALNPLLILHNKHLVRMKGLYFDILGASRMGESASSIILAMPNKSQNQMNILLAKQVNVDSELFTGKGLTLITGGAGEGSDSILVENIGFTETSLEDFSHFFQKKMWTINPDHLRLPLLRARIENEKKLLQEAPAEEKKMIRKAINRSYSEIMRRVSISLGVFTLTLLGAACGLRIGRRQSNAGFFIMIGLVSLYMVSFFAAKAFEGNIWASGLLYVIPQTLMILFSILLIRRISRGKEA